MNSMNPSLLSYSRSLQVGKGLFYSIHIDENNKETKKPIAVEQIGVRGSQSTHSAGKNYYDENIHKPNLQRIEIASLPADSEIYECHFTLNVLAKSLLPEACNSEDFVTCTKEFIEAYSQKKGFEHLAELYIEQIINGSWLWRNKDADNLAITITVKNRPETFPVGNDKCSFFIDEIRSKEQEEFLIKLISEFAAALKGNRMLRLEVFARGKIGFGQEIFPSQEFIEREKIKNDIGKILAKTMLENGTEQAFLHPQKIGNALRTIDTWHSKNAYPLPVEPYGLDSKKLMALRYGENNFYSLLENLSVLTQQVLKANSDKEIPGDAHFVIACFIRGGVFSFTSAAKAEERKRKEAEKLAKKGLKPNKQAEVNVESKVSKKTIVEPETMF